MKKKLFVIALCMTAVFALGACEASPDESGTTNGVETHNPWVEYDTMDEAKNAVGFEISVPESMEGYSTRTIRVCTMESNEIIEVVYDNGDMDENKVRIRKAPGTEDISGVYESYEEASVNVGEWNVIMKGRGDSIYLATWMDGDYTYSIYTSLGISDTDMAELVSHIQ